MGPLRIGILAQRFPQPSETFVLAHANWLYEQGHDVYVFVRDASPAAITHASYDPARWRGRIIVLAGAGGGLREAAGDIARAVRSPSRAWRSLRSGHGVREVMQAASLGRALQPFAARPLDLFHCHFGDQGAFGVNVNRAHGIAKRVLTTFHGYDINAYYERRAREYAALFAYGDAFTANSQFTARRAEGLGCPASKLHLWRMGITVDRFQFAPRAAPPSGPVRLLTVARLTPKKGIDVALRAVALARQRVSHPLEYHVVGGGTAEARDELVRLAADLGIADIVHWHSARSDVEVRRLMNDAHLFVLASRTAPNGDMEGQGVVLQEAQASGLPILSTLHNGIPESVIDGETARLVPEGDAGALAAGLVELVAHPEAWSRMGAAGHAFVRANFDLSVTNGVLANIYADLLQDHRSGADLA